MMREIKFRALTKPCTLSESMGLKPKIVYGTGIFKDPVNTWLCSHNDAFCMAHDMLKQIVDPETLGQYTGLKDKNGVEIYEGDVVLYTSSWNQTEEYKNKYGAKRIVTFKDGSFINCIPEGSTAGGDVIEIIGNILEEVTQ